MYEAFPWQFNLSYYTKVSSFPFLQTEFCNLQLKLIMIECGRNLELLFFIKLFIRYYESITVSLYISESAQ